MIEFPDESNSKTPMREIACVSKCGRFRLIEDVAGVFVHHKTNGQWRFIGLYSNRAAAITQCESVAARPAPKHSRKLQVKHGDLVAGTAESD